MKTALRLELVDSTVTAKAVWPEGHAYRSPAPALTREQLSTADRGARAMLDAEPGSLLRTGDEGTFTYRRSMGVLAGVV